VISTVAFRACQRQRGEQCLGRAAQRRDQHQQRHHGQILEQQHAHHPLAVLGLHLQPLGHELDEDRRAAHGQRAGQRQRRLPFHLPQCGCQRRQEQRPACCQHDGQTHLEQPQPEHMAAHGAQLGQVEFQADHEHQEHHAKLTQVLDALGVIRQRQRVGPISTPTTR
jgi:hypothetical protein